MTEDERTEFKQVQLGLARIETALTGNGTKGLSERVNDNEEWQEKHEDAHQAHIQDQHEYRLKREQKEADEAKRKMFKVWAFVGSIALIIISQIVMAVI